MVLQKFVELIAIEFGQFYGRFESLNLCSGDLCLNLEARPIARKTLDLKALLANQSCSLTWELAFNLIAFLI